MSTASPRKIQQISQLSLAAVFLLQHPVLDVVELPQPGDGVGPEAGVEAVHEQHHLRGGGSHRAAARGHGVVTLTVRQNTACTVVKIGMDPIICMKWILFLSTIFVLKY